MLRPMAEPAAMHETGASTSPDRAGEVAAGRAAPSRVGQGCPYLLAAEGGWRSALPAREHRCTAVDPPTAVAPVKQRRLCLEERHRTCATFLAVRGSLGDEALGVPPDASVTVGRVRPTRWRFAAATPTVLDRTPGIGLLSVRSRLSQAGLVALVVLAFGVLAVARSTLGSPETARASGAPAPPSLGPSLPPASPNPSRPVSPGASPQSSPSPSPTVTPVSPSPSSAPSPTYQTYRVRSGDTLSAIAARFGTTVKAIVELNGIADPSLIHAGQLLKIP